MSALILGIPSKGRLQEQATRYLADTGMEMRRAAGARDYRGTLSGQPDVEVKLLSSGDIAGALGAGEIHLGMTGEDLLRDSLSDFDARVTLLTPLGFGFADVVVAVPRAWIDVATMADLDDVCTAFHVRHHRRLRVATKYTTLTRLFFAAHGIGDYRIVESLGATEGAPAAGTAEAIVDITTTGATLAQNELKVLEDGVILKSQAQLAASRKARWDKRALVAAERLTSRIAARELARDSDILRVRIEKGSDKILAELAKASGASLLSRPASAQGEHVILTPRGKLMDALEVLRARGITGAVTVHEADYAFVAQNPMMEKLKAALR